MYKTLGLVVLVLVLAAAVVLVARFSLKSDEVQRAALQKTPREAFQEALRIGSPGQIETAWREWQGHQVELATGQSLAVAPDEQFKAVEIPSFPVDLRNVEVGAGKLTNRTGQPITVWLYPKRIARNM